MHDGINTIMLPLVMSEHDQIVEEIERFIARTGMTPTAFGKLAVNNGRLVGDLRRGRDIRLSTVERIRAFIRSYEAGGSVDGNGGNG